jgi:hypothetical protein
MGNATERFEDYVSLIAQQLGHADRVEPFRGYCTGLLLPVKRKSVEPMAAQLAPLRVRSEHQRLHHFVADAAWSDTAVLAAVRDYVLERVGARAGMPEALLIDDTGRSKLFRLPQLARDALPRLRDLREGFDTDQTPVHVLNLAIKLYDAFGELLDADTCITQFFLDDLDTRKSIQNLGDNAHGVTFRLRC